MVHEEKDRDSTKKDNENASLKPDAETLHRTDPQENMKGPLSSLMQSTGESFDTDENAEEADREKEKNL
jgi:hypothetical protein